MTMESTQDRKVLKSMRGDEPTLDTCESFTILFPGVSQELRAYCRILNNKTMCYSGFLREGPLLRLPVEQGEGSDKFQ